MSRCSSSSYGHHHPRVRFYKRLKKYIKTLFVLFALGTFLDSGFFEIFGLVALFWGLSLALKAIKLGGIPGTNGWLSQDWEEWIKHRHNNPPTDIPGKQNNKEAGEDYDPLWKDKDLV